MKIKVLSLFDGMSVAQQALKDSGIKVDTYYASEIDKYAIAVTQSNFPETVQLGGVSDICYTRGCLYNAFGFDEQEGYEVSNIDLLIGGSPCQDLSIAKKNREGLKGSRSGLFWEYVRIRDEVKPKYFILENVNSMPQEAKEVISEALGVEPVMINASLVSAQNRKRLFWVGKWNGEKYEQVEILQPKDRGILLKDILEDYVDEKYNVNLSDKYGKKGLCELQSKAKSMTASMHKGYGNDGCTLVEIQDTVKVRKNKVDVDSLRKTLREHKKLSNKEIADKLNQPITKVEHWFRDDSSFSIPDENVWFDLKKLLEINTDEFDKSITEFEIRDGKFDMSKRVYSPEGKSPTITTISGGQQHKIVQDNYQIRKLTPTECLRLQSMPDDYFDKAIANNKPISNTQRYKMCGNAFNKEVIVHILKHLDL